MKAFALLCTCLLLLCHVVMAQDSIVLAGKFSRYADKVNHKAAAVEKQLTKQSEKTLQRLQKQQEKAYKALYQIDSNAAKAFLLNSQKRYNATLAKLNATPTKALKLSGVYLPGLDSMNGVLTYLDKLPGKDALPGKEKIAGALAATTGVSHMLDQSMEVKKLMLQQQQQLKGLAARYKDLDISKELKQYNKEFYYYSQRVQQAKQTLNDPQKIEGEVLKLLGKTEGFKNWMQQNGQLSGLFGNASGNAVMAQSLIGLQTRQGIQKTIQSRMGGSLHQVQQMMSGAVQQAQGQLNTMRNRLQHLGNSVGAGLSTNMPDFKPNNQKTKPFLKRLEKGWNLQATQHQGLFPSVNELGLNIGYKLNDKSVIGLGAAYRFGLGESISKVKWTNEGMSFRSYIDMKWKGNWWISGGYEQTYWSRFHYNEFSSIPWQASALIGLTKKLQLNKKKEMKMQLLYDVLKPNNDSKSFPIIIRTGINF